MKRDEAIKLVEKFMLQSNDPDVGTLWAYLQAGCDFGITQISPEFYTFDVFHRTFDSFETGASEAVMTVELDFRQKAPAPYRTNAKTNYTRQELIYICERAVVPANKWRNRDTPDAQSGVGQCFMALKRGDDFMVIASGNSADDCVTDERTIWVTIGDDRFYLPTPKRLDESVGGDWY